MARWMKALATSGAAIVLAALLATGIVSISIGGAGAGAQETDDDASRVRPAVAPSLIAVAIGQIEEEDGHSSTVDLRATIRGDRAGGAFRFYCEEYGYYNGGVQTLVVEDGVITVTGAGGLFPPEGGRVQVHYEAQFALDGSSATIHVEGPGVYYTMEGPLEGLANVWEPPSAQ